MLNEEKIKFEWLYKIKLLFKYGINNLKELDEHLIEHILNLQREFYKIKIQKLTEEYNVTTKNLEKHNFERLQKEHQEISEKIFKNRLYKRYYK